MSQFYEIDSARVSHREYWWGSPSPLVIIGWILKWLRVRIPSSTDDPNTKSTLPFVTAELPSNIAPGFFPPTQELAQLGFIDPVCHVINDPGTRTTHYWTTFRHLSGQHFVRIHQRFWRKGTPADRGRFVMFFTEFADGTFLVSSSGKPDMLTPATVRMNRRPKADIGTLWTSHQSLVGASAATAIVPVRSVEDLVAATERHHILVRDFHLARGVFRPRTAEETAAADAHAASVAQAQGSGSAHPEVLAELEKLQEQKANWKGALWLLIGSAVFFLAAGRASWDWKFTLWLIPVLLFHETGHWLAMRIFKYRNLRMFFIPFFGAAVTGRNWNVPGWKKSLVSLAGPLPGILLGCVLTVVALITKKEWINEAALILLILNGFNLLPILPLDGGHVLHATLFCRNRWLDIVFRVLAVLALFTLSVMGFGRAMLYLAIFMGVSLPLVFKIAKVTDDLRRVPLVPPMPGEDRIPPASAEIIISAVKAALPANTNAKQLAQHSLGVFETLNARPPGVWATIGLLTAHLGGFVLAAFFLILLMVSKEGAFADMVRTAANKPAYRVDCDLLPGWQGRDAAVSSGPRNLLTVTWEKRANARTQFVTLTNRLPPDSKAMLFGSSVLLALPAANDAAREKWYDELYALSTNTFVVVSNHSVALRLMCVAPNATVASNILEEVDAYFAVPHQRSLIPPWSPEAGRASFAGKLAARRSWAQFDSVVQTATESPELDALSEKMLAANRRGSRSQKEKLATQYQDLVKKLQTQALETVRNASTNEIDPELLNLYIRVQETPHTNRVERSKLMAQAMDYFGVEGDGQPATRLYGARFGYISRHSLILDFTWVNFDDAFTGPAALMAWLCEKNCKDFRYTLSPGMTAFDGRLDDEEIEE